MNARSLLVAAVAGSLALATAGAIAAGVGARSGSGSTVTPEGAGRSATTTSENVARHAAAIALGSSVRTSVEELVGLAPGEHLVVRDGFPNEDGSTGIRYDRTYQGIPVLGEQVITSVSAGGRPTLTREPLVTLESVHSTTPILTESDAVRRVAAGPQEAPITSRRGQLVVDAMTSPARLAWAVTSSTGSGARALDVTLTVVDAASGAVLREEPLVVNGAG